MRSRRAVVAAIATAIITVLAVSGCVAGGPSASDPRLEGTWHLASGAANGEGLPIDNNAITLVIGDGANTGGSEPCSNYSAKVVGDVGPVFITATITSHTRDDCTNSRLADLEHLYISALTATTLASVNEGVLLLNSPDSMLVFLRSTPTAVDNLLLSHWQLVTISGPSAIFTAGHDAQPVLLRFDGALGLTISSPCEATSAVYSLARDNFAVANFVTETLHQAGCTPDERKLADQTRAAFGGPLSVTASVSTSGRLTTLVVSNLDDDLAVVWRATK